jgi:hypothetical protein
MYYILILQLLHTACRVCRQVQKGGHEGQRCVCRHLPGDPLPAQQPLPEPPIAAPRHLAPAVAQEQ